MTKQVLYRHFDAEGQLLYVGITMCPFTRTRQHGMLSDWFDDVVRVEIERFDTRSQAEQAEWAAIRREHPIHNRTFNRKPTLTGEVIIVYDANMERLPNSLESRSNRTVKPRTRRKVLLTREQMAQVREANVIERQSQIGLIVIGVGLTSFDAAMT